MDSSSNSDDSGNWVDLPIKPIQICASCLVDWFGCVYVCDRAGCTKGQQCARKRYGCTLCDPFKQFRCWIKAADLSVLKFTTGCKVRCCMEKRNCEAVVELNDLWSHLKECQFRRNRRKDCKFWLEGCDFPTLCGLSSHNFTCPYRGIYCTQLTFDSCKKYIQSNRVVQHLIECHDMKVTEGISCEISLSWKGSSASVLVFEDNFFLVRVCKVRSSVTHFVDMGKGWGETSESDFSDEPLAVRIPTFIIWVSTWLRPYERCFKYSLHGIHHSSKGEQIIASTQGPVGDFRHNVMGVMQEGNCMVVYCPTEVHQKSEEVVTLIKVAIELDDRS